MDFVKVEGLGNDFIVVDGPVDLDAGTIKRWCDRRFGVGADGVLELTAISGDAIGMRYWNADGREAEMCGNGLRCLVRLAVERGLVIQSDIVVETASGPLPASLQGDGLVRALVGRPSVAGDPFVVDGFTVHPVTVGNPHGVVFVRDPAVASVAEVGRRIEHHEAFPSGANAEFVATGAAGAIDLRVWERGVGETLASGTGATAAAYAAVTHRGVSPPVEARMRGGTLTIEFDGDAAWMIGPGNTVYHGTI